MARPSPFAEHRWVGDKRSQVVHDREHEIAECALDELVVSERFALFGPDTLPEARNRGYRQHRGCREPEHEAGELA